MRECVVSNARVRPCWREHTQVCCCQGETGLTSRPRVSWAMGRGAVGRGCSYFRSRCPSVSPLRPGSVGRRAPDRPTEPPTDCLTPGTSFYIEEWHSRSHAWNLIGLTPGTSFFFEEWHSTSKNGFRACSHRSLGATGGLSDLIYRELSGSRGRGTIGRC